MITYSYPMFVLMMLIAFTLSVMNYEDFVTCIAHETNGNGPSGNYQFTTSQILTFMPLCITQVERNQNPDPCDMDFHTQPNGVDLSPMKDAFQCLNEFNNGQYIQAAEATVVLYSGKDGNTKANGIVDGSASGGLFGLGGIGSHGRTKFTDDKVPAANEYYFMVAGAPTTARFKMLAAMGCMWLIYNADVIHRSNQIDTFMSLKGYETIGDSDDTNVGLPSLIAQSITKALVINNYFWRIEMVSVAHVFQAQIYAGVRRLSVANQKLKVHLRTYRIRAGVHQATGWSSFNLFGPLEDLSNVPVIYEKNKIQFPIFKIVSPTVQQPCNLKELIDIYNEHAQIADRITDKLHLNIPKLIKFVVWTEALPFHIYDIDNHILGVVASHPQIATSDAIPAAFAKKSHYNHYAYSDNNPPNQNGLAAISESNAHMLSDNVLYNDYGYDRYGGTLLKGHELNNDYYGNIYNNNGLVLCMVIFVVGCCIVSFCLMMISYICGIITLYVFQKMGTKTRQKIACNLSESVGDDNNDQYAV